MRPEKKAIAEEIHRLLSDSEFVILTDYLGLSVQQLAELREKLAGEGARLQITKNRIFRIVAAEFGWTGFPEQLRGPSAMVTTTSPNADPCRVAKVLTGFTKEHELPVIKLGVLKDRVVAGEDVVALANLPAREVLIAQLVSTVAGPLTQLAGVMQQKVSSLVRALQAVADKKSGGKEGE